MIAKACPFILRQRESQTQLLAFAHPQADLQFVKGTIEQANHP